jgi:hypothetical protein
MRNEEVIPSTKEAPSDPDASYVHYNCPPLWLMQKGKGSGSTARRSATQVIISTASFDPHVIAPPRRYRWLNLSFDDPFSSDRSLSSVMKSKYFMRSPNSVHGTIAESVSKHV